MLAFEYQFAYFVQIADDVPRLGLGEHFSCMDTCGDTDCISASIASHVQIKDAVPYDHGLGNWYAELLDGLVYRLRMWLVIAHLARLQPF